MSTILSLQFQCCQDAWDGPFQRSTHCIWFWLQLANFLQDQLQAPAVHPPESSHPSSTTPGKQNTQHSIISLTAKVHVEPDVNNMTLSMESPSADGGLHHKHQIATKEVITTDTSGNIQAYMGLVQIPILLPKKLLQLLSNLNPLPLLLPLGLLSRLWW